MSLSFNLKNAGPLSQIGIEIFSIQTALELAIGAYGWFKASERSASLTQILSVSGGELVSTSSFNYGFYKDLRTQHGQVQGILFQDRTMQRTALPKASTTMPEHTGIACLRALTAGILCLYSPATAVVMLQDLIPYALLQLEQEDKTPEIDGPLLTSLSRWCCAQQTGYRADSEVAHEADHGQTTGQTTRQTETRPVRNRWVSAVATEENGNTFREYLLKEVAVQESRLTGVPVDEIMQSEWTRSDETNLVLGVLRWILTPAHKREFTQYPTRSLQVWTTAAIMAKLGFDVYAASAAVRSVDDYDRLMNIPRHFGESPDVFLVVTSGAETDPMMLNEAAMASNSRPRSQLTVVRGIPWLAFRHLRGASGKVNTQYLSDVWSYSYRSATACFKSLCVESSQITIEIAGIESETLLEHHRSLLSEFSPLLYRICGPPMHQFVPDSPRHPGWNSREISDRISILRTYKEVFERHELEKQALIRDNCFVLLAIVLGTIYGLCSRACIDNGQVLNQDSEISFMPDVVFDGGFTLKRWARAIGLALNGALRHDQWADLLFELFLAMPQPAAKQHTVAPQPPQAADTGRLLLGAQANGMTAVSDLVVVMTIRPARLSYYHIGRGQILNLPVTEDGYIQASSYLTPPMALTMDPEPENKSLYPFQAVQPEKSLRIDIEPCWEDDPRTIIFRVREMGKVIAPVNIMQVVESVASKAVPCSCSKMTDSVTVPVAEQWQHVSIHQLKRTFFKGVSLHRADIDNGNTKVLIDASQSETVTAYAIGILYTRHLVIAMECLACAYSVALQKVQRENTSVAIIIPWKKLYSLSNSNE